ncbi:hypothetical protein IAT38_002440 [Cryptococcus sp. DSM 104549]
MASPTSTSPSPSSPLAQSPLTTTSALPATSQLTTHASNGSARRHHHHNLPPPPPADRIPPPKGRSGQPQKFKILRKGKDKDRRDGTDLEDDWTMEGMSVGGGVNNSEMARGRESEDVVRGLDADPRAAYDQQVPEAATKEDGEKKERKSKGRQLVKKTSRLFGRDKDKSSERSVEGDAAASSSSSSLAVNGSRQASYSSANSGHSGDSQTTTNGSTRTMPSAFHRPTSSIHSRNKSPRQSFVQSHSRRASQDSQSSWQAPRSIRSVTSHDSPVDPSPAVPIPSRQGSSFSGASVPSLRQSLPQPAGPNTPRSPDTFPSKMSNWFSHLLPATSESPPSTTSFLPSAPADPPSPARKPPSAAVSFFSAARQKAVDGVRHLLDTEAQPDRCPDTIYVMGVAHPGWRPSTPQKEKEDHPLGTSFLPDASEFTDSHERRGSNSSGKVSPSGKEGGVLRPAAWRKGKESQSPPVSGNGTGGPAGAVSPPGKGFTNLWNSSTLSLAMPMSGSPSKDAGGDSPSKKRGKEKEVLKWPDQFHDDFRSTIWCTYRSQYAPILSLPPNALIPSPDAYYSAFAPPLDATACSGSSLSPTTGTLRQAPSSAPAAAGWGWPKSGDERGLTSDAGWGCMLRTGQSLLANAIVHLHLGRDWRVPTSKPTLSPTTPSDLTSLEGYAEYVKILSWFLDDPSPLCPFSVHRMALIGKELGKEVGEWFGPSTAAGALKTLANSFDPCGLSVATATDSIIYKSDVYAASNIASELWERGTDAENQSRRSSAVKYKKWGDKAVLILVGIRLGLDGVNPIYYESIKTLFTIPQSVGIAGGRPGSSYYFVGSQANSLFYLDPHFTRPAVPLEVPPAAAPSSSTGISGMRRGSTASSSPSPERDLGGLVSTSEEAVVIDTPATTSVSGRSSSDIGVRYRLDVVDVDDVSESELSGVDAEGEVVLDKDKGAERERGTARGRGKGGKTSRAAKRLSAPVGSASEGKATPPKGTAAPRPESPSTPQAKSADPFESEPTPTAAGPRSTTSTSTFSSHPYSGSVASAPGQQAYPPLEVDPQVAWYASAYSEAQLRTFHCEKVKKMPLSGLDPSMLLGFMCRDEAEFEDFVGRVAKLPKKIFTVLDEPPSWDEEDDPGLESVSEPDMDEPLSESEPEPTRDLSLEDVDPLSTSVTLKQLAPLAATPPRASASPTPAPGATAEEEEKGSAHASVPAVDIVKRMDGVRISSAECEGEEEEWVGEGMTPGSQGTVPVMVERPVETASPSGESAVVVPPPVGVPGSGSGLSKVATPPSRPHSKHASPPPLPPPDHAPPPPPSGSAPVRAATSGLAFPHSPSASKSPTTTTTVAPFPPSAAPAPAPESSEPAEPTTPTPLSPTAPAPATPPKGLPQDHPFARAVPQGSQQAAAAPVYRQRMESWVDPGWGGEEAPNGESLL